MTYKLYINRNRSAYVNAGRYIMDTHRIKSVTASIKKMEKVFNLKYSRDEDWDGSSDNHYLEFDSEHDAMMFKLRWG